MSADLSTLPRTGTGHRRGRRWLAHLALIAVGIVMVYPLLWLLSSSVKPDNEIFTDSGLWPSHWDLANYAQGWHGMGQSFAIFFGNSFFISTAAVVGNVFSCSLAAFAFARLDFAFRRFWFAAMLTTIMLPKHVTLVPQYTMYHVIGWVNTFYPLMVPHFLAVDAFFVFLLVQFIRGIPTELDDAARVDGCGSGRVFVHVTLPLLKPALVTTTIFTFIWSYNDFFSQLIYLNDPRLYTVPLGLRLFLDATGESSWGPLFAMSVLALLPAFLLFLGFQRLIVEGVATSGLKG